MRKILALFSLFFKCLIVLFPWFIKRALLVLFFKYELDPQAYIGFSFIYPKSLIMRKNAEIGSFNVAVNLEKITMNEDTSISRNNWITGYPLNKHNHFQEQKDRKPYLIMGKGSAITKNHMIDCTDLIEIGEYTSVAGYGTQILTHSTSLEHNKQRCAPIRIGARSFVGTRSILLPGVRLPDSSVLGAGAVLTKEFNETFSMYGGVPAKFIKTMEPDLMFLNRSFRPK